MNSITYTINFFGQYAIDVRTEPTTPLPTTAAPITTEPTRKYSHISLIDCLIKFVHVNKKIDYSFHFP